MDPRDPLGEALPPHPVAGLPLSVLARTVGIAVLTLSTAGMRVAAQQSGSEVERFWISAGAGVGAMEEVTAAFSADVAYQRGAQLLGLHSTAVLGGYELSHVAASLGVVYGRASTGGGAAAWSAGAGLAFVQVDISGRTLENTVGVPITVQTSLDSQLVGIGLGAFANLNGAESYGGAVVTLRLGRLRRLSRSRGRTARSRARGAARTRRRCHDLATRAPRR